MYESMIVSASARFVNCLPMNTHFDELYIVATAKLISDVFQHLQLFMYATNKFSASL